jgi:hypothetical protein
MKLSSASGARPTLQMRHFRLAFVLRTAALLVAFAAQPLRAQDSEGQFRRGPHGPRPQPGSQPAPTQSTLPATQPTTLPAPAAATTQPTPAPPTDLNQPPVTRARVTYANGQLEVRADNSSLLQILHDISRMTRMTITGGFADTRIFGDYGPASPGTVLSTLLDGTGANMILQQDPVTGAPIELVLTQRAGGPPPASPNGPGFDDSPFPEDTHSPHPSQTPPPANTLTQPQATPPDPNAPHATNYVPGSPFNPPTTVPAAIPTASSTPTQPAGNGASTPESIYQQLLQMRQAKTTQSTTPPANTTPATTPASSTTAPK